MLYLNTPVKELSIVKELPLHLGPKASSSREQPMKEGKAILSFWQGVRSLRGFFVRNTKCYFNFSKNVLWFCRLCPATPHLHGQWLQCWPCHGCRVGRFYGCPTVLISPSIWVSLIMCKLFRQSLGYAAAFFCLSVQTSWGRQICRLKHRIFSSSFCLFF